MGTSAVAGFDRPPDRRRDRPLSGTDVERLTRAVHHDRDDRCVAADPAQLARGGDPAEGTHIRKCIDLAFLSGAGVVLGQGRELASMTATIWVNRTGSVMVASISPRRREKG